MGGGGGGGGGCGGPQRRVAAQPLATMLPSDVKRNVRQPLGCVLMNGPGMLVPEKVPKEGAVTSGPLKMVTKSKFCSVANWLKVMVTTSPGTVGQ